MSLDAISGAAVRRALRAIRYGTALSGSPLLQLDLITVQLRTERLPDTGGCRAWLLTALLDEAVAANLQRLRAETAGPAGTARGASAGRPGSAALPEHGVDPEGSGPLDALAADFRSGGATLEAWSLIAYRYFSGADEPLADIARRLGITYRTLARRLDRGHGLVADALRAMERPASREIAMSPSDRVGAGVVVRDAPVERRLDSTDRGGHDGGAGRSWTAPQEPETDAMLRFAPDASLAEIRDGMLAAVRVGPATVVLSREQARMLAREPPGDLECYRLGRVAAWSDPRHRLDERFVELSLLLDEGEEAPVLRWRPMPRRFSSLDEALRAAGSSAAVVVGPPGCGKTTLLRHLELETALEGLQGRTEVVTLFASLAEFPGAGSGGDKRPAWQWLAARWQRRCPHLPTLESLAAEGRMLVLLDALNEMPHEDHREYRGLISSWRKLALDLAERHPANRMVFSCRTLDYSAPLSSPALRVPQVAIEPMSDAQVQRFLSVHAPAAADALWDRIAGTAQLDALRRPYLLRLFIDHIGQSPDVPVGQARLFTDFVRRALRREIVRENPLFEPDLLIAARDYERALHAHRWSTPYELPGRGPLFPALSRLAWHMQAGASPSEMSQLRVPYDQALEWVVGDHPRQVIEAAVSLGILDEDLDADVVFFSHQLVQEYFAARRFAEEPDPARVGGGWRRGDVRPSLDEAASALTAAEPLPPLAGTSWSETVLLAAPMAVEPDDFVGRIAEVNLPLAGRCAALPDASERISERLRSRLQQRLIERSRDPGTDLRARIEAAAALADLQDPRFRCRHGPCGPYIVPPMVGVVGGEYPCGSGTVTVGEFAVGRFPVTNSEWLCFMQCAGYDDERWWDTAAARAWRSGASTAAGTHAGVRHWRGLFLERPGLLEEMHESGEVTDEAYERWHARLAMSDADFDAHLCDLYPGGRVTEPRLWRDSRFRGPAQPVVGVCWYEARAYGLWLRAQSGIDFRLPTDAEWEAAARGPEGRAYAYGDTFDRWRANVLATHLRQTSPVGVFPDGDTPEGIADLTGNVNEWTSSAWGTVHESPGFGLPYDGADGRESADAVNDMRRVLRGGSWCDEAAAARADFRNRGRPDGWDYGDGFRLAGPASSAD